MEEEKEKGVRTDGITPSVSWDESPGSESNRETRTTREQDRVTQDRSRVRGAGFKVWSTKTSVECV